MLNVGGVRVKSRGGFYLEYPNHGKRIGLNTRLSFYNE